MSGRGARRFQPPAFRQAAIQMEEFGLGSSSTATGWKAYNLGDQQLPIT